MYSYGLLGEKLLHSYSPKIHSKLGDYEYSLIALDRGRALRFLKEHPFKAINVTIPYKKDALAACDLASDEAKAIGSANTLVVRDGKLCGYNTDAFGFEYMLKKGGIDPAGRRCIVLGSGGASATVRYVLSKLGAAETTVISRSGSDNYNNIDRHYGAEIIVNTTPVGMFPNNGESPVDLANFTSCVGAVDLIYNPARTKFLLDAKALGIPHINGLYMLAAQAKRAAEIFFDRTFEDSVIDRITKEISAETKNIALIGMPGCGKTTVGRILEEKTGRELVDIDGEIARETGREPAAIIVKDGEKVFRQIECEVLSRFSKRSGLVVACGGGIVTTPRALGLLAENSNVFYIERPLEELDITGRPLSEKYGIGALYKKRLPLYLAAADFRVSAGTPEHCAAEIMRLLGIEQKG